MKRISVSASKKYDVCIERGLLGRIGEMAAELIRGRKCVIVSDDHVAPLYLECCAESMEKAGFEALKFVFQAGEASKNAATYLDLINFCAENRLTRADVLIALGGGVVGDITGFAAATYLRGVRLIQVPTTLLACVDSSVGGKTAVDLAAGKNLLGAFYQPDLVICDPQLLESLPGEIVSDGMAEVIKYGMYGNSALLDRLREKHAMEQLEYVLETCIDMKRLVVEGDEFDTGGRQILNFGHTFAHSIEKLSGYQVPHGRAVAVGMMVIARAAAKMGYCTDECVNILEELLNKYALPAEADYSAEELAEIALSDKKRAGDEITLAVPVGIGESSLLKIPVCGLIDWAKAGVLR